MANTSNLSIPLLEGSDMVSRQKFNEALIVVDTNALPVAHESSLAHWPLWESGKSYSLKDLVRTPECPQWGYFECTKGGTSGTSFPTGIVAEGATCSDGSAEWVLRRIGSGTKNHQDLDGRSLTDQHPILAITGLETTLAGKADLDTGGKVPITQLPDSLKELKIVNTIAERDALAMYSNLRVHVIDATADPTVTSGWAEYLCDGTSWTKTAEKDSIDVVLNWGNIVGKPTIYVPTLKVGDTSVAGAPIELVAGDNINITADIPTKSITIASSGGGASSTAAQDWLTGETYERGNLVLNSDQLYVCLVAHTAGNFADDIAANKWKVAGGSSTGSAATISEWQPNTYYPSGTLVIHEQVLYQCLTSHLSYTNFQYDVVPGSTKWQSIGEIVAQNGYLNQWTNLGVAANQVQYFTISYTSDFRILPPSVLKVVNNPQNVMTSQNGFDATGATSLSYNANYVTIDGTMRLKTKFQSTTTVLGTIGSGSYSLSKISINQASFKTIEKLEVC